MKPYELIPFDSPESLARHAAVFWLNLIPSPPRSMGVALSGGRIAKTFFQASARLSQRQNTAWEGVHFFWADERCVPPDHEDSNYRLARENLQEPLRINPSNIHRLQGELDPVQAATQAARALRDWSSTTGRDPVQPSLDLIILGMGEDGHVASLFPDGPKPGDASDFYVSVTAAKPPPQRLSLNYQMIQSAQEVLVLASGKGKEQALQVSLTSAGDTPLARVIKARLKTRIFTDIKIEY